LYKTEKDSYVLYKTKFISFKINILNDAFLYLKSYISYQEINAAVQHPIFHLAKRKKHTLKCTGHRAADLAPAAIFQPPVRAPPALVPPPPVPPGRLRLPGPVDEPGGQLWRCPSRWRHVSGLPAGLAALRHRSRRHAHWLRKPADEPALTPQTRRLLFLESFLGNFLFTLCMISGVS
jgi:hypothetical protein